MLHIFDPKRLGKLAYRHSGKMGDIVFSMSFAKATGGGIYYLVTKNIKAHKLLFGENQYQLIRPLLLSQEYIKGVYRWEDQKIDYCLDRFRKIPGTWSICERHFIAYNFSSICDKPWLKVDPKQEAEIVISRAIHSYNEAFPWKKLVNEYKTRLLFLGTNREYDILVRKTKCEFPHYKIKSMLEAAQIIAGSKIHVGNESCFQTISEGLKHNLILESSDRWRCCRFYRSNAFHFFYKWDFHELFHFLNMTLGISMPLFL